MTKTTSKTRTYQSADKTREKILNAARKLFVANGFAGTSMGSIALQAKVNHSLLFHHFSNKHNLWLAVKIDIVKQSEKKRLTLPCTNQPFESFMHELVNNSIYFYLNNPDIMRMMQWQRLEKGKGFSVDFKQSDEAKRWIKALQFYQNQGDIRETINLDFYIITIFSLTSTAAFDPLRPIESEKDFEAYVDYCIESLVRIVK